MKPAGSVFYKDEYDTLYKIDWETTGGIVDVTSIVETPFVYGIPRRAFKDGYTLYRYGMISVQRQLIRPSDSGYEIVAEGTASYLDYIKMSHNCDRVPIDNFVHHLDYRTIDETEMRSVAGPHWADPSEQDDDDCLWADVGSSGTEEMTHTTAGYDLLTYVDVWPDIV
jgi:hypothetical protein